MNTLLQIVEIGNFKCLMGDCPDTCCKGWEIPVDSRTLKLWQSDPASSGFVNKLKIIEDGNSPSPCAAKIKLKDDLSCSFLSDSKLCSIHSTLGERYLSHTCNSYPREINKFWGMLEKNMTLSCPEVANTILNKTEPLSLEYVDEDSDPWIFREIAEPSVEFRPDLIVNLYRIRTLCLLKAQDRSLSLERRLNALASVAEIATIDPIQLCNMDIDSHNAYFNLIESRLEHPTDEIDLDRNNIQFLLNLFKPYVSENSFLSSIIGTEINISDTFKNEVILEHILFTLLLRSLFPFLNSNPKETLKECTNIILLIDTLLVNQASLIQPREVERADKITLIQKTMRLIDHYKDLQEKIKNYR